MSRDLTEEHLNSIAKRAKAINDDMDDAAMNLILAILQGKDTKVRHYTQYIDIRRQQRKEIGETFAKVIDKNTFNKLIYG